MTELQKDIDEDIRIHETVKDKLDREMRRQSADQEELLGEQEDAVREVLQTQSGLTEMLVCFNLHTRNNSQWIQPHFIKINHMTHPFTRPADPQLSQNDPQPHFISHNYHDISRRDREQMMAIHQHQALAVINMLFMNRLRAMKR